MSHVNNLFFAMHCVHLVLQLIIEKNSLTKHVLSCYFSKCSHMSTLYEMLGTLVPPSTSMLFT